MKTHVIEKRATFSFHEWIRDSLNENKPYDQFVREIVTATGAPGQSPAVGWYREVKDAAAQLEDTAQLFLGLRIQCARCHHHPFEKWSQQDYYSFSAFFSQVGRKKANLPDEEVVYAKKSGEVRQPRTGKLMKPKALGGPVFDDAKTDRRVHLAAWLTSGENPFFAKSLTNRVWYHLVGRGVQLMGQVKDSETGRFAGFCDPDGNLFELIELASESSSA